MRVLLTLTTALALISFVQAQNQQLIVTGTEMCEINVHHTETENYAPKVKSNFKVSASVINIGQTPNGFGCGFGPLKPVSAHESLNTIAVIHRSDFNTNGDNGTGSFRYDLSTDGGTTWNNNIGPIYNPPPTNGVYPGPGRYPSATVINPENATSANGAYLAYWGPTRDHSNGASWGGLLMATQKLDNTDRKIRVDSTTEDGGHFIVSRAFWKASETVTFGLNMDDDQLGTRGYLDTAVISKGVWNASSDSLEYTHSHVPIPLGSNSNGDAVYAHESIAFGLNGQTGYIVILGYSSTYPTYGIYHPIVLKTTNGGTTWSAPQNVILDSLVETSNGQQLIDIYRATDSTWTIGNLSTSFDCDLTVDKNGNPHIFTNVCPAAVSTDPGSGSTGTEFSIYSGMNAMVDIYSLDGGSTWKSRMVGFPQTFRGGFGVDPANPDVTEDNRPHCSRSADGSMIFFHWFDTDAQLWGTTDNVFPDWWINGYDVDDDDFPHQAKNLTTDITTQGIVTFGNIAPESWVSSTPGAYKHHCVLQQLDQTTQDFYDPAQYMYMTDLFPTTSSVNEEVALSYQVSQNYPNPASEECRIRLTLENKDDFDLTLINSIGQVVRRENLGTLTNGEHIITLDVSDLAPGAYVYHIRSGEGTISRPMIVE